MIKLHLHYLYTEKLSSEFPPVKCAERHHWKKDIPDEDSLPTDILHTPISNNQPPVFSTNGALEWVKMC